MMMTREAERTSAQSNAPERTEAGPMSNALVVEPLVDIYENRDEILLVADFPGVPKESLQVRLDRSELTIEGAQGRSPRRRSSKRSGPSTSRAPSACRVRWKPAA
jgi:HSP20 family protein